MKYRFPKTRARAPLRLGLAGGGTDLSPYCDRFGGAILNTTIDRFAFASVLPGDGDSVIFEADDLGVSEAMKHDIGPAACQLPIHAAVYQRMMQEFNDGRPMAMTIKTTIDAPPGSGLGSSSALVVALVDALRAVLEAPLGPYDVARLAYEIERIDLGLAGGRQDQYAAAFGGINFIEFPDGDRAIVNPLRVAASIRNELESSLVVCFSGLSRRSADIIDRQTSNMKAATEETMDALHALKSDAIEMKRALLAGEIERMAELLNQSWASKRATADGISTDRIDQLVQLALDNGALGGKVSGAGGGGFMFFLVHPERRYRLIEVLSAAGAASGPIMFSDRGSETWQY